MSIKNVCKCSCRFFSFFLTSKKAKVPKPLRKNRFHSQKTIEKAKLIINLNARFFFFFFGGGGGRGVALNDFFLKKIPLSKKRGKSYDFHHFWPMIFEKWSVFCLERLDARAIYGVYQKLFLRDLFFYKTLTSSFTYLEDFNILWELFDHLYHDSTSLNRFSQWLYKLVLICS